MDTIFRTLEASIDSIVEGERAVVARVNTAGIDRLKTVIDPLGCDVSHFNKTRSVLWHHGQDPARGMVPIGQGWVKVRRSERDMLGKTSFGTDDFSDLLFQKYKSGELRGWSIKAGVHEASPPTKEELRADRALADCEMVYRKWDLIEFSATPTPGNSDCLTMLVSRGLITAPEGFVATEAQQDAQQDAQQKTGGATVEKPVRTERYIESDGTHWTLHEPDGQTITRFADPEDAEECMRAMRDSRSFERILMGIHTEQRAKFEARKEDLLAEIQLRLWGVV